jgi:acyl carrier protein
LEAIFKDKKLSFMLLCSSLSAIEGPLGQVDYCSANAFLDAFAQSANSTGERLVVSVNWDAWQEVGMAVNTVVPRELEEWRQESLKLGILPGEGIEVFGRSLNAGVPQLAVSTTDFQFSVPEITTDDANADLANESEPATGQPEHVRPELASVYVSPRSETEQTIASIWQQLLGVEKVGIHDNFFELGGHSLLAIQIVSRLRVALQGDVNVQSLFNAPTVAQLGLLVEPRSQAELEAEKLEETLKFVEQLSETEIQKLLAAQDSQ